MSKSTRAVTVLPEAKRSDPLDLRVTLIHAGPPNEQGETPMLVWYKKGKCLSSVWHWPPMLRDVVYNWVSDAPCWIHAERCARQPQTPVSVSRHFLDEVMPAAAKLDLSDEICAKLKVWEDASLLTIADDEAKARKAAKIEALQNAEARQ